MCCGNTVSKVVHGAAGITQALTGINLPPQADYDQRKAICEACAENVPNPLPVLSGIRRMRACNLCQCIVGAKIRVATESCPAGKWSAVKPAANTE